MKNIFLLALTGATLLIAACTPKNEEVTDEQIQVSPPAEALDSIADTEKDGLRTDENEINPTLPLPQPVLQLLTQKYPGWEQPDLTNEAKLNAEAFDQGPFIVRGDFNGDAYQDYALQLQKGKEILVIGVINDSNGTWTAHELTKDILFNDRGKLKSMYYLHLSEKGSIVTSNDNKTIVLPYEAVAVGIENKSRVYALQDGTFQAYYQSE